MSNITTYDCITETAIKNFKPTYLYIKRHSVTGLLYFGKTTKTGKDFETYNGSGTYWKRHIKKHGNIIETVWFCLFTDIHLLVDAAVSFSEIFNIVEDEKWANSIKENGLDGSGQIKGFKHSEKSKTSMSKNNHKQTPYKNSIGEVFMVAANDCRILTGELVPIFTGRTHTDETKTKMKIFRLGKTLEIKTILKMKETRKGKTNFKNKTGEIILCYPNDPRVLSGEFFGLNKGRTYSSKKKGVPVPKCSCIVCKVILGNNNLTQHFKAYH